MASLARRLKVGARLVTLNVVDIANLGHANDWMTRTDLQSGPSSVSWSDSPVDYYVYRKLKDVYVQSPPWRRRFILAANPTCRWACPKCTIENPLTAAGGDVTRCDTCFGQGTEVRAKRQRRAKTGSGGGTRRGDGSDAAR